MNKPPKDTLYQTQQLTAPFQFDDKVAAVFPDMIQRSVPGYGHIIHGIEKLSAQFVTDNSDCYDLGCSLGAASLAMSRGIKASQCRIFAIDNSAAMLERCQLFIDAYKHQTPIELKLADLQDYPMDNAAMVVINFTLQFIPLAQRAAILSKVYAAMKPGGLLVLSEKVTGSNDRVNNTLIKLHHDFKRDNGYSELEIAQKRNALENVLIPETELSHQQRLHECGFSAVETWFKHFNFCSLMAII